MPVRWNLKQWLAVERQIYRPSELHTLLEEKAGSQLSLQAISSLLNYVPSALRLSTIQALCNALNCKLSDFCEVLPDALEEPHIDSAPSRVDEVPVRSSVDATIREIVLQTLAEQGLISRKQEPITSHRPTISVLLPSWVWSIIPDLVRGIVETITYRSYDIALYSISDEEPKSNKHSLIDHFLATPLSAGLVAVFPGRLSSQLTQLSKQGFPVVVIDDQEVQVVPWVGVDNTTGAYMAARHLISLGHRRIAHIKGPAEYLVSYARCQGYCQALLEAGMLPDPELILEGDFLPPSGRACASQLFELPPEKRPTAIFAASDQMAYGVLAAAEDFGLSIPGDIGLVGFDDDQPSAYTHPPLTTVKQPYFEMGKQSIAVLLSLFKTPKPLMNETTPQKEAEEEEKNILPSPDIHVQLQAQLVVRESCGANYCSTITSSSEFP